jgi:FMN reductase
VGTYQPLVVGVGGTVRPNSSTERALRVALNAARAAGARTLLFGGMEISSLPMYNPELPERTAEAAALIDAIRAADGVIIGSPGYHGTVSGLVKNALDYLEDTRVDAAPYLHGRAVGCIATAMGWQAAVSTLFGLRAIAHALRGWPTPLGGAVNTAGQVFDAEGHCLDQPVAFQLEKVGHQVVEFAWLRQQLSPVDDLNGAEAAEGPARKTSDLNPPRPR